MVGTIANRMLSRTASLDASFGDANANLDSISFTSLTKGLNADMPN